MKIIVSLAGQTKPVLFIGGGANGKRMAVPDLPIVRLPLHPERGLETEDYRKERLATQNYVFEFYVALGMSTESAISQLLACYKL